MIRLFALLSRCSKSSSTNRYSLPSNGLKALSCIVTVRGVSESLGSTGLSASMTRSVISMPVGSCQDASLIEFGLSEVSSTPSIRVGGWSRKSF